MAAHPIIFVIYLLFALARTKKKKKELVGCRGVGVGD